MQTNIAAVSGKRSTGWVLIAYFAEEQLKADYSKHIWKEENCGHGFVAPWLATGKLLKTVGAGVHKVGKIVYGPTLTLILIKLSILGMRKKGKLDLLRKVGFSRRYKKMYRCHA